MSSGPEVYIEIGSYFGKTEPLPPSPQPYGYVLSGTPALDFMSNITCNLLVILRVILLAILL